MTSTAGIALPLLLAFVSGLLFGAAFYGGLWWTVRHGLSSPRPARWFLGSLALRLGIAVPGIYLIGQGHWERLMLCLLGFLLVRPLVMRLAGGSVPAPTDGPVSRSVPPCTSRPT